MLNLKAIMNHELNHELNQELHHQLHHQELNQQIEETKPRELIGMYYFLVSVFREW